MSRYIAPNVIQSLVSQTDIIQLISQYVPLKNHSTNFIGLCPFHQEKTPSFLVNPERQLYHCFGCGAGGNAINFLMRYDDCDFLSAVEKLAQFNGIELIRETSTPKHQWAYEINQKACDFFKANLKQNKTAMNYLIQRGLSEETIEKFALGFAPNSWNSLKNYLLETGNQQTIKNAIRLGLLSEKNHKVFDKFRERIIFPIRNSHGRVVGFGGRIINQGEPKYLNSPQSEVFSKSTELYGLFEIGKKFGQLEQVVMVEGYMDVIALFNGQIEYAIACLGTAINENHINNLIKLTNQVVFCFDGDTAGFNAAKKGIDKALAYLSETFNIQLLWLKKDQDPDSYMRNHSKAEFEKKIKHSQNWADFLVQDKLKDFDVVIPIEKERFFSQIKLIYQRLKNPAAKRILLAYVSENLMMDINRIEQIINPNQRIISTHPHFNQNNNLDSTPSKNHLPPHQKTNLSKRTKVRVLVLILIFYPELLEKMRKNSTFKAMFENRLSQQEIELKHKIISKFIQPEYLSELALDEVHYLIEIIHLIEEKQNPTPALMMIWIRDLKHFDTYFNPLIRFKNKILLIDHWGEYDEKIAGNDFLDSFIKILNQHEKKQKLAKIKC